MSRKRSRAATPRRKRTKRKKNAQKVTLPRFAVSPYRSAGTSNALPIRGSPTAARGPLANTVKVTMVYSKRIQLFNSVDSDADSHVFSCNGLFAPDVTGAPTHKPMGFDQLIGSNALYQEYLVIGMKATFMYHNSNTSFGAMVSMRITESEITETEPSTILENKYVKAAPLAVEGGNAVGSLDIEANPNSFMGVPNPMSHQPSIGTDVANPTSECFLHLSAWPVVTGTGRTNIHGHIRIEYTVILKDPVDMIAS